MADYPRRESHFAHRITRLMTKSCVAQDIGPEGCWLVTVIAHQEDAKRYSGPVLFYNSQLMVQCGFASEGRLIRVRERTVQAKWLHYEAGGKQRPGRYWSLIPADAEQLPDTATDESDHSVSTSILQEQAKGNGSASEGKPKGKRSANGCLLSLSPSPSPSPKNNHIYSKGFLEWFALYPRKVAKADAAKAYRHAVEAIRRDGDLTPEQAHQHLCDRTTTFAKSDKAKGEFCPYPATWLNQARYDDDPTDWRDRAAAASPPSRPRDPALAYEMERAKLVKQLRKKGKLPDEVDAEVARQLGPSPTQRETA